MAIIPIIVSAAKVAHTVYKHRKTIYAVLTAQDRYISKSFRYGGYGKATSYGVRSGALAGSIAGAFINNADDSIGNGVSTTQPKYTTGPPNKTRRRQPTGNYSRKPSFSRPRYNRRCPRPRKY